MQIDDSAVITLTQAAVDKPRITRDIPLAGLFNRFVSFLPGSEATLFTKDTRPDTLSFERLSEMRKDSTIKNALLLRLTPILSTMRQAEIDCDDPDQAAFLQETIIENGLLYRLAQTSFRAWWSGVAFHEKRFTVEDLDIIRKERDDITQEDIEIQAWEGAAYTYKDIAEVNPVTVKEINRRNETKDGKPGDGSFDGFTQAGNTSDGNPRHVIPQLAFVFTYGGEFGDMWGYPLIRDCYPYWFWKQFLWKLWVAWLEKKAIPPTIVRHPIGTDPISGKDYGTIAILAAAALNTSTAIAFPAVTDEKGNPVWDMKEQAVTDKSDLFERAIKALEINLLRVTSTPERVFSEARFGTRADAQQQTDTFLLTLDADIAWYLDCVERYVLPPLQLLNYGTGIRRAKIRVPGLTDEQRAFLLATYNTLMLNAGNQDKVDFSSLSDKFGVPLRDTQLDQGQAPGGPLDAAAIDANAPLPVDTTGALPAVGVTPPDNLVLSDFEQVMLASTLADLSKYDITRDPTSALGWKVINKATGRRLVGFVALKIVNAFQTRSANEAKAAAKRAQTEAAKAARAQASAARKAATQSAAQQRKAAAEAKRAAGEQTRAQAKETRQQQSAQAKETRQQESARKKREAEQKRTDNQQTAQQKRDQRKQEQQTRQSERDAAKAQHQADVVSNQATQAEAAHSKAQVAQVGKDRSEVEAATRGQDAAKATQAIQQRGYEIVGGGSADRNAAVATAQSAATNDPDHIYTVLKAGTSYVIARKAKKAITTTVGPSNIAADDREQYDVDSDVLDANSIDPDEADTYEYGYDYNGLDADASELFAEAALRISRFLDGDEDEEVQELLETISA